MIILFIVAQATLLFGLYYLFLRYYTDEEGCICLAAVGLILVNLLLEVI